MLNLMKPLPTGVAQYAFIACLLLGHRHLLIKCNSSLSNDVHNITTPSTERPQIRSNISSVNVKECYSKFSGKSGNHLGESQLGVYILQNKYGRFVLPQLSFLEPKWTRLTTILSVCSCTCCAVVFNSSSPFQFPYCGKRNNCDLFSVEYDATDTHLVERRKLDFRLPFLLRRINTTSLEEWEIFIYVDTTNRRKAVIHWESALPDLNVTRVQLNITCHGIPDNVLVLEDVFSYEIPYHWLFPEMICRCYIKPWLPNHLKWGHQSSSPLMFISRGEVLLLWSSLMILLFAVLVFLTFRLYHALKFKWKHIISDSVMLIYEAKTEEQFHFVSLLAKTFRGDYHIKVYFDHQDIPQTVTKDPLKWFVEAIPKCQYFIFIQLPFPENAKYVPPGVYSSQKMATENIFEVYKNSSRIITVALESCPYEETWICSKLRQDLKYVLPNDLSMLVGKKNPFKTALGTQLKEAITDCIEQIKDPLLFEKRKRQPEENGIKGSISDMSMNEEKDSGSEESTEIAVPDQRNILVSLNLDGGKSSGSDTE